MAAIQQVLASIGGAGGGGSDPDFASRKLLLAFDGADESTTFTDLSSNGYTLTAENGAKLGTEQFVFGSASGDFTAGTTARVVTADLASLAIPADFALQMRIRFSSLAAFRYLAGIIGSPISLAIYTPTSSTLGLFYGGGILGTTAIAIDTWYDVEVSRVGSAMRWFVNGTTVGSGTNSNTTTTGQVFVGSQASLGPGGHCWIDNFRYSHKGEHTADFTPDADPFPTS